jgi:hypothetical protein
MRHFKRFPFFTPGSALAVLWCLACLASTPARALVLVEQGRQVEGLWVFPIYSEPKKFVYLPTRARLVTDDDGDPKFSFTFFVNDAPTVGASGDVQTVREAGGGAIVHFLVTYDTPTAAVEVAERALRRELDDDAVEIAGPMVFNDGRYTVVSSVLAQDEFVPTPLQAGSAPILAGNQLALSFRLTPENAAILLGTFRSNTPDLSIVFELDFAGLTEAYRATMIVDWEKAQTSLGASLGGSIYVVSAEAKTAIDRMLNEGAVELRVDGDDTAMETLLQHVYDKTLELMFAPVQPSSFPQAQQQGIMQALGQAVGALVGTGVGGGSPLPFSVSAAFQVKDLRAEGETVLSFHKRAKVNRRSLVTVNLGDLYQRYSHDLSRFGVVRVGGDPIFQQRHVYVGLDGALVPEFASFVDAVQVTLRKKHPDGTTTLRELRLTREQAAPEALYGPMVYSNAAGEDAESWRSFEYQTAWSFRGGGIYVSPWQTTTSSTLMVGAPYHRQEVFLDGDFAKLAEGGVRALTVSVASDLFGQRRTTSRVARIGQTSTIEPVQLVLPENTFEYTYVVRWVLNDGRRLETCGQDDLGFIFVDDLPTAAPGEPCS